MSPFKKFFKRETNEDKSPANAISELRKMEEMLTKKQEYLEHKVRQEIETARANGRTNRRVALLALKKKKRYELQLQQIDGTLTTIEMQREALESANRNTKILTTMKQAADALKNAHLKVDDVHEIVDDIAEQQALAKEITDAISSPLGAADDVDEDDLYKELEELDQQELDRKLLDTHVPSPTLPDIPAAQLPSTSGPPDDELDEELKKLETWAS